MLGRSSESNDAFHFLTSHSFRKVLTFGRDTIQRFGGSVSSLKKMTARGFEDIIQVCPFI